MATSNINNNSQNPLSPATRAYQIPAQDNKGHSVKKTVRIPPQLEMQIEIVMGSKKFPYRTDGELMRHALVDHLQRLSSSTVIPNNMMGQLMTIIEMVQIEEEKKEFSEVVDRVVKAVNDLTTTGNNSKAQELMDKVLTEVEKINDAYWRKKYRDEIARRLNHVKHIIRVGLRPSGYTAGVEEN